MVPLVSAVTSSRGFWRPEVRLLCWLRGEPDAWREVAMSMGDDDDDIADNAGCSKGKSGTWGSSSSKSGGKRRSSEVKAKSSSSAACVRFLGKLRSAGCREAWCG